MLLSLALTMYLIRDESNEIHGQEIVHPICGIVEVKHENSNICELDSCGNHCNEREASFYVALDFLNAAKQRLPSLTLNMTQD